MLVYTQSSLRSVGEMLADQSLCCWLNDIYNTFQKAKRTCTILIRKHFVHVCRKISKCSRRSPSLNDVDIVNTVMIG